MLDWDVVIVGGGPAGLSAALVLGRCVRRVLLVDAGTPRNRASKAIHAFLSRDGVPPSELRRIAHDELRRYEGVEIWVGKVTDARRTGDRFKVWLDDGRSASARKILLATGLFDDLPAIERIEEYFGRSVFHCPYCDGWEMRGMPVAVYGKGRRGLEMARAMTAWTDDLVLCTDGPAGLRAHERLLLEQNAIGLREERVAHLDGKDGCLDAIVFATGDRLARRAMFFDTPTRQQSMLAAKLGCTFTNSGGVRCGKYEATDVPGVYVAGNTIKDVHLAIVAGAEGAKAALGINKALTREDFAARATGRSPTVSPLGQSR